MKKYNFLAFDIGATNGRTMLGTLCGDHFEMREITRFPNAILELHGKYYWNIYQLYDALKEGLKACTRQQIMIDSIGIDTWGVDFGFVAADGSLLGLPRAYRDPYTEGMPEAYFRQIPREEVYRLTGIQVMNFNSLYQLYAAALEQSSSMQAAKRLLFIPDLLSYFLTGRQVCEQTIASTSQLVNPITLQFETRLLDAAGVVTVRPAEQVMPGTLIGYLTEALAAETGVGRIPVMAVAGHDTASAVAAVPAANPRFAYLSSGTWSLMGIETEAPIITESSYRCNFTNEGGIEGTTRFLKNITGMWLLEQCRKEWERVGRTYTYSQLVEMAASAAPFASLLNPDDSRFANPHSMMEAIVSWLTERGLPTPETDAEFVRCIFYSLANRYREVLGQLIRMAPFPIEALHVIGGGSMNPLLNQLTANAIGLPVLAGPSEATAIGNCLIQAQAAGLVADRWAMRRLIASAFPVQRFMPETSYNQ